MRSNQGRVCIAMVLELPGSFGDYSTGDRVHVVGKLVCRDDAHDCHLFSAVHNGSMFTVSGLIDGTGDRYSLLNAEFRQQFPIPLLGVGDRTSVIKHESPSWSAMYDVI